MTRRQTLAVVLPVLAVLATTWFVVWSPTRSDAATARAALTETEALTQSAENHVAYARAFADDPTSRTDLDRLRVAIPATTAMNEFIAVHAQLADASGVIVSSFVPDLPADNSAAAPIGSTATGLSITVVGTLPNTLQYLDALSASPRLIVVDSLDVSAETETTLATALRVRIFDTDVPETDDLELDEFGEPINGSFEDATEDDIISAE